MAKRGCRQPALISRLAVFVLITSSFCFCVSGGSGKQGGKKGEGEPPFAGLSFSVQDATIPPGGLFQFQLLLTEPKPIGHGSTRPSLPPGPVRGIALNDPIGQTVGVAIVDNSGVRVNFSSPQASFGTDPNLDTPILTIAQPISASTPVGQTFPLSINLPDSFWFDASGQPYPQEVKSGTLTIGGTQAISDVEPGSGLQPAGTTIRILGIGFTAGEQVNIEGTNVGPSDIHFISANEIDVILRSAVEMDGTRVRVRSNTQKSIYFPYFRAQAVGASTHALLAECYPLFSRTTYTSATLSWNRTGSQFTGLALQNPGSNAANVTVQMLSSTGDVLGSVNLSLAVGTKITRDLLELFAGAPAAAASVKVTSAEPIQVLGLLGDDATGDVEPVIVSTP